MTYTSAFRVTVTHAQREPQRQPLLHSDAHRPRLHAKGALGALGALEGLVLGYIKSGRSWTEFLSVVDILRYRGPFLN